VFFNAYVQAVNRQQSRQGILFEGRFKHVFVDKEEYLVHICSYIHLNPVKAGLVKNPEDWLYSNYLEWIGERGGEIIDQNFVIEWFDNPEEYRKFVMEGLHTEKLNIKISQYVWD
jgi:hypothetical protein